MGVLRTDNAKAKIQKKVKEICEAHFQHQNPCKCSRGTVKANLAKVMKVSGASGDMWLLALQHVCMIMNSMALKSLEYQTPYKKLFGVSPNISALTQFHFSEPVYFKWNHMNWKDFPGELNKELGYWVGVAENVGHALTYKILMHNH